MRVAEEAVGQVDQRLVLDPDRSGARVVDGEEQHDAVPDEEPGQAREIDWSAYDRYRARLAGFVPVTRDLGLRKIWAATIDYTPDHLPILGPALRPDGSIIGGVWVAAAAGHGMMWGPGVARVATDLTLEGRTDLIDVTDLGLDRFDPEGRSRLPSDPVALPYPAVAGD